VSQIGGLEQQFDDSRAHLRAVAYRLLGSASEADDAVQEAWLKISRAESHEVKSVRAWLTTVVARVCLDMLRTRRSRREQPLQSAPEAVDRSGAQAANSGDPEAELTLAETIGSALLIVLDRLTPAERVAFVLHDMFDLSFEELAPIVKRTPAAARQLASRARRRVRGSDAPPADMRRHQELVTAFLAASRDGDFERLLAVLSPDVVLRADDLAVRMAAANQRRGAPSLSPEVRGASLVAEAFKGRARGALPALIDGEPGAVWATGSQVRAAFVFRVEADRISGIDIIMEPGSLAAHDLAVGMAATQ
jgi:RNA polymerase sigma factor (sigma-70 family)